MSITKTKPCVCGHYMELWTKSKHGKWADVWWCQKCHAEEMVK